MPQEHPYMNDFTILLIFLAVLLSKMPQFQSNTLLWLPFHHETLEDHISAQIWNFFVQSGSKYISFIRGFDSFYLLLSYIWLSLKIPPTQSFIEIFYTVYILCLFKFRLFIHNGETKWWLFEYRVCVVYRVKSIV